MNRTLSFYTTVLYKNFLAFTTGELHKLGLSYGQMPFIVYVGKHPGCTSSRLKEQMHLDWGHTQRCITRLVDGGFLSKEQSEGDGRTYHLNLTESGEHAFRVCHQVFQVWDENQME